MIDALELGATLYVPATHRDLWDAVFAGRTPGLRSVAICLEDAVRDDEVTAALEQLGAFLARLARQGAPAAPYVFVRPRGPAMLDRILRMPGAEQVAGFVLPKATADTLPAWLALPFAATHRLMPTIETPEAFDPSEMHRLREQLLALGDRILALRIGGNDLLQTLGLRRSAIASCYQGPLGPLIAALAGTFLPYGFALSAPVMERFDDPLLLRLEVQRDLEHGLFTKSAIHPAQVPVIQAAFAVSSAELDEARAIIDAQAPAVFARDGRMCEPATHRRWAEALIRRAALFGVADPLPVARQA